MEHRSVGDVQGTVTDIDERRGRFLAEVPFYRTDTFRTQWVPSSFRDSFDQAERTGYRFPVLWQHRMDSPIGVVTRQQITRRAAEFTSQLSSLTDVPLARQAYSQLKDGHVSGVSFGFERRHETPHPEERGVTILDKVAFHELSAVTLASVPGARVLSVRSSQVDDEPWTLEDVREELRDGMAVLWRAGKMTQWDVAQKLGVSRLKVRRGSVVTSMTSWAWPLRSTRSCGESGTWRDGRRRRSRRPDRRAHRVFSGAPSWSMF
jgi:HK97 family phage prohead protease